jgi:hypothetical protein
LYHLFVITYLNIGHHHDVIGSINIMSLAVACPASQTQTGFRVIICCLFVFYVFSMTTESGSGRNYCSIFIC